MMVSEPGQENPRLLRERYARDQGQPRPHPDAGQARRHRQAGHPAGRSGLRARARAQLRAQPAGLRPALPLPARDRRRALRLCRAAGHDRGRAPTTFAGAHPDHPQGATRANSLARAKEAPTQAVTAACQGRAPARLRRDRLHHLSRLGRAPTTDGGDRRAGRARPRPHGLAVVIWSYPRGGNLSKQGETAIDICAYAAHMAALLGAHIIKVKPPTAHLELEAAKKVYEQQKIDISTPGRAHPPCRAVLLQRQAHRRLLRRRGQGPRRRLRTRCAPSATAAATARSSAATPSSGRATEALKMLDAIIRIYRARPERARRRRRGDHPPLSHHAAGAGPAAFRRHAGRGARRRRRRLRAASPRRTPMTTPSAAPPTCCGRWRSGAASPS